MTDLLHQENHPFLDFVKKYKKALI
ncbi:MAG: hypothetical protein RLZ16_1270, partial [Bacteroidota bacterium]